MELLQPSYRWLKAPRVAIHLHLPVYVRFLLGIWLGVLVMVMSTLLVKPVTPLQPDPFAAYGALLDDQAGSAVVSQGFVCTEGGVGVPYAQIYIRSLCEYRPAAGSFERIEVMLSGNHHAEQITFTVRENALMVGDLALLWGRPPIITTAHEQMTLNWPGGEWGIVANTDNGRFSYQKPVYRVTFITAF